MLGYYKVTKQLIISFTLSLFLIRCLCQCDCLVFAGVPHGAPPDAGLSESEAHSGIMNIFVHKVTLLLYPDIRTTNGLFF